MRKFKHLTYTKRIELESYLKANMPILKISELLGVHRSTIYREIKKGLYVHELDLKDEIRYSATISENKYQENLRNKGSDFKIGRDHKLANFIEDKIVNDNYSPEAALAEILKNKMEFKTTISKTTLYSYIDKGLFLNLTNDKLPVKGNRKREYKKVKIQLRKSAGTSIEYRPKHILERKEFGHWEMDTVVGKRGESKKSILVLTERKTRQGIFFKLQNHTSEEVVTKIDSLELEYGEKFNEVFKTITVDNGTEFSDCSGLENSKLGDKKRTKLYYCHAYSSYERGSNENQNRLIRRHIKKGTCFDEKTEEEIKAIENWVNNYPRKIFHYKSSYEMFKVEIENILRGA